MPKYFKRARRGRKKRAYKKNAPYRQQIARIPRPLNVKARSAIQNVTFYNSFFCKPALDGNGGQQNFAIKLQLNSPWLFRDGWDVLTTGTNQVLTSNIAISAVPNSGVPVPGTTTCMPGVADGPNILAKYAKGCVVGTKVVLVATPAETDTGERLQPGLFYAIKHSQKSSGLQLSNDVNKINSMPFRQAKQISANRVSVIPTNTGYQASRITVNHSPKKFNNVKDLRDNQQFAFSGGTSNLTLPEEGDFLTVGAVPLLNSVPVTSGGTSTAQVVNFRLDMRVEQTILWTEPLEETSTGEGNYSYPYSAYRNVVNNAPFLAMGYGAAAYRRAIRY
jgi:hypothetical protein